MIRSLNDVLNTHQSPEDIKNCLNSPDLKKEKFILAIKLIYNSSKVDNGFTLLRNLQTLDTSVVVHPSFIEELLNPDSDQRSISFANTLKILDFILKNASHTDIFEMAIHQNLLQYTQKAKPETKNLEDVLNVIALVINYLNNNRMTNDFLESVCGHVINLLSRVPAAREAENVKTQASEKMQIVEFFHSLKRWPQVNSASVEEVILNQIYMHISHEEEVSPLASLGLIVISEPLIGGAVNHLLQANHFSSNSQKKQIRNIIKRLVAWIRATGNIVPLHIWVQKVLIALHHEGHHEILNEIVLENFIPCCLTMLLPVYQTKSSLVIRTMLEVQKCEDVMVKIMPHFLKVLMNVEKSNSEVFEVLMDSYADYMSFFPNAGVLCRPAVEYLALHSRDLSRSSVKQRRLTSASAYGGNVRIGLENLGNSCYINSVIQALFMAKSFCRDLLTIEQPDRQTSAMQRIFALLLFSERSELNLRFAMQHIRPQDFMPGLQHDSSEFMGSLLDKLHEADKKSLKDGGSFDGEKTKETEGATGTVDDSGISMETPSPTEDATMAEFPVDKIVDNTSEINESTIVQRNFGGKISTTCVCSACKSKSVSIDSFRDLALSFPEKPAKDDDWDADVETGYSVQQLLDYYFTIEKLTLDGDNQYHCEKCKSLCDGVRCTELLQPPKNLILTLKHFRYDSRYHTRSKLLIKKMFHDEKIAVKVRTSHDANISRTVQYQLHSAVVHSGVSLDSGHYYTFAREKDAVWYKFNDSYVSTSTLQELHNLHSPNTPYILFYQRISTASSTASSASCSALIQGSDDKLPNFDELPQLLQTFVLGDNAAYEKETKKFFAHNKAVPNTNRWNDDDPPSSCGSNFGLESNRYIF